MTIAELRFPRDAIVDMTIDYATDELLVTVYRGRKVPKKSSKKGDK